MFIDRCIIPLIAVLLVAIEAVAHEGFLPLHHHSGIHEHGGHAHGHELHSDRSAKHGDTHIGPALTEQRFALASGARFTRYSIDGKDAHLWEVGVGVDYAVVPWLHLGGDFSHGWFDSEDGSADGWLTPHAHLDFHIPLGGAWEVLAGFEVGFPGGEEALVGDHWEWAPHVEVRYDPGNWYAQASASLVLVAGEEHDHAERGTEHSSEAADQEHSEEAHTRTDDFHEVVDPHGERELRYSLAAGVRLLESRLSLESQLSAVHVLSGESPADNYVRAGVRASFTLHKQFIVTAGASVPISDAERNQWQASMGIRVSF